MSDYWELRDRADDLFWEWFNCKGVKNKKEKRKLFDEYLNTLREASKIAPSVDDVWAGHVWRGR